MAARTGTAVPEVRIVGFAGGSSGADLLFHEACSKLEIAAEMFLTVPEAEYRSVGIARDVEALSEWTDRFNRALDRKTCHVLSDGVDRPTWRDAHEADPLWSRWIRWMFHHARVRADVGDLRAVVVWDGKPTNTGVGVFGFMQAALHNGVGVRTIRLPPVDGGDGDGSTPPGPVRGHDDRASVDSASVDSASDDQASQDREGFS